MTDTRADLLERRVSIGVDPASTSGWAILRGARSLIDSGTVTTSQDFPAIQDIIQKAISAAGHPIHLIVVAEEWGAIGKKMGAKSYATLCESWGVWRAALSQAGIKEKQIFRVHTAKWRAAIIGGGNSKIMAQIIARQNFGVTATHDQAEAICIAMYGSRL